jgi:hypothetical protein
MSDPKPKGSGYFAVISGFLFFCAFVASLFVDDFVRRLTPEGVMRVWFVAVAVILVWWGVNRIRNGRPDPTIGQSTIQFVMGTVSLTVALLALTMKLG